jgi:hypothetical protein
LIGDFALSLAQYLALKLLTKLYWEQEFTIGSCVFPLPISIDSTTGNTMQVRMQAQLLSPSVQNRYHSICISLALPKVLVFPCQKSVS